MFTIRGKLLQAFLGVITALSFTALAFLALGLYLTSQYKSISDAMIAEYQLVEDTATLIDAYNRRVQSAGAESVAAREQARITDAQEHIQELFVILDAARFDTQSTSGYLGFKASVEKFTAHIRDSLVRFEQSSVKDYFADFNEANKQYGFVRENGTVAVFDQLKYAASIRAQIEKTYRIGILLGLAGFAIVILMCAIFVLRFSRRLAAPLAALSTTAGKIAAGETAIQIEGNLGGSSEIQSLARSFETMVRKLLKNIAAADALNKELAESSQVLTKQNDEFARLNNLMIGRELKMIELKKEIDQLKGEKI